MRLRTATCVLLAAALLAGCAAQDEGTPTPGTTTPATTPATATPTSAACPTAELTQAAYDSADGFLKEIEGMRISGGMRGTVEGDVGELGFAVDPEQKALSFHDTTEDLDVRVNGSFYSLEGPEVRGYGRDHRDGALFDEFYAEFLEGIEDDESASFEDDLTLADYNVTCTTVAGQDAIEFRYEKAGEKMVMQVERAPPHRALGGEFADPLTQDNYRLTFSYGPVKVDVDDDLQRLPVDIIIDVQDYKVNERGGITMTAAISDETAWVPLEELDFRLMDTEGRMWYEHELQEGFYDMEDNDTFEFDDVDGNGLLSEGDVFTMDVGAQLDIVFFDTWADQVAAVHGQS